MAAKSFEMLQAIIQSVLTLRRPWSRLAPKRSDQRQGAKTHIGSVQVGWLTNVSRWSASSVSGVGLGWFMYRASLIGPHRIRTHYGSSDSPLDLPILSEMTASPQGRRPRSTPTGQPDRANPTAVIRAGAPRRLPCSGAVYRAAIARQIVRPVTGVMVVRS